MVQRPGHLHFVSVAGKLRAGFHVGNGRILNQQVFVFGLAEAIDERLLLLDERFPVEDPGNALHAVKSVGVLAVVNGFHRADERLGRDAADIHAGAADGALAHHNNPGAALGDRDSGGKCPRSRSDDKDVGFRG